MDAAGFRPDQDGDGRLPAYLTPLSRLLARLLRYESRELGLTVDEDGWCSVQEILCLPALVTWMESDIETVVEESYSHSAKRFEMQTREGGQRWLRAANKRRDPDLPDLGGPRGGAQPRQPVVQGFGAPASDPKLLAPPPLPVAAATSVGRAPPEGRPPVLGAAAVEALGPDVPPLAAPDPNAPIEGDPWAHGIKPDWSTAPLSAGGKAAKAGLAAGERPEEKEKEDESQEAKSQEAEAEAEAPRRAGHSQLGVVWEAYQISEEPNSGIWWSVTRKDGSQDYFLETEPEAWRKWFDPGSKRWYWHNGGSDEWFFAE